MRTLTFAVLFAAACGGSKAVPTQPTETAPVAEARPQPPAPATLSDAELETMMRQSLAMFTAMSDAAAQAAGDCGKLSASVERVLGDHKPLLHRAKEFKGDADIERRTDAWTTAHKDEVLASLKIFTEAAAPCSSDPAFQAALEKLDP